MSQRALHGNEMLNASRRFLKATHFQEAKAWPLDSSMTRGLLEAPVGLLPGNKNTKSALH